MTTKETNKMITILRDQYPEVYHGIKQWCVATGQQLVGFVESAVTDHFISQYTNDKWVKENKSLGS